MAHGIYTVLCAFNSKIMTNVEKTAEWIKSERQSLIKLSNEINALVFSHNMSMSENPKYYIEYRTGMSGNNIELNISEPKEFNSIDKKEIWCLNSIFESHISMYSTTERIKENVKKAKLELKDMKKLAQKYIALNCA